MNQEQYRRKRLLIALRKLGFTTVQQAAASLDKGTPLTRLKGVGPILAATMREWLAELEATE